MLRGLPPATERFLADLARIQKRAATAQRQLTTGLKLTAVSDDPDQISRLLQARTELARAQQVQANLGRVKVEVDTSEQALQTAVKIIEQARVLGTRGGGTNVTFETRAHIAAELKGLLERMVAISQTQIEGRYVFSGDNDLTVPYDLDLASPTGVTTYAGSTATRQVSDATGELFPVALDAQQLFDSSNPGENVFQAINGMRRALLAVDDPPSPPDPTLPSLEQALIDLSTATTYLNRQTSFYGLVQNRVQEAANSATHLEISYRTQIASIEEADLAEAAVELTQSTTTLNAALQAKARAPRTSLFDYLG